MISPARPTLGMLCVLFACSGSDSPEPPPEPPTAPPAQAPARSDDEPATTPPDPPVELQIAPAERGFSFVDPCYPGRGATPAEALRNCRRVGRTGRPVDRQRCSVCVPGHVVTVGPDDPIAMYHGCCGASGATPEAAYAECARRHGLGWCDEVETTVAPVLGPYTRHRLYGEFDHERYRFLDANGWWVDETGEAPCFPAGTLVSLSRGEVPIEEVRVGDVVRTLDPEDPESEFGPEVRAEVLGLKTQTAPELLVVRWRLGPGGCEAAEARTSRCRAEHVLRVTPLHPIWSDGAWRPASTLEVGGSLTTLDGAATISSVTLEQLEQGGVSVYTLQVAGPHTFLAGDVLVHNY